MVLKSQDLVCFTNAYLGQGLLSNNYAVNLLAIAGDIYGSQGNATGTVVVTAPTASTSALSASVSAAINSALTNMNAGTVAQLVNAALNTINSVDCTVRTACNLLNREMCQTQRRLVDHVCQDTWV